MDEYMFSIDAADIKMGMFVLNPHVRPEKVIYNKPATIVFWNDGTKTVVRCHEGDVYDEREGFLLCCAKKLMGNSGAYNDAMKGHVPDHHSTALAFDALGKEVDL